MLKRISFFPFALLFIMFFLLTSTNALAYSVYGQYSVYFQTGYDGTADISQDITLADSPSTPLAYEYSYTTYLQSTASAKAGFWGFGDTENWYAWLTEGTGVSQSHPNETFTDPASMTISFDFFVEADPGEPLHTAWWDAMYLQGVVGAGGYVEFIGKNDLYVGQGGTETYNSTVELNYRKDTAGDFYVSLFQTGCDFTDSSCFQYLTGDDDYLHLTGTYTFIAKNDGGPSAISFTPEPPPVQTPEPATLLLFVLGLLGIAPLRKKMK